MNQFSATSSLKSQKPVISVPRQNFYMYTLQWNNSLDGCNSETHNTEID